MASAAQLDDFDIPPHVPLDLVRPGDIVLDPEILADPYAFMSNLHRTHPPVFYTPSRALPNSWILTKLEDCFHVLRHPELFHNRGSTPFPRDPDDWFNLIPVEIDPPQHRQYRAILDPLFSPKGILALRESIRALADDLIDSFVEREECEFTEEFSRLLPVYVFLDLMGLPRAMIGQFVKWVTDTLHSQDPALILKATNDISDYLKDAIAEKQANPDNGALSAIVHGRIDGAPLSFKEMLGFSFFVFIAGIDTVYATLNNIFLWLARNEARRHEIVASPDNLAAITEELLRAYTVTFSGRTANCDTVVRGVSIKEGDKVLCCLPAANYDPEVFANPLEINFHRPRKPHLAFSGGVHSCMGSHLARLEIRICLEEFLKRIPDFEVKAGAEIRYLPGGVVGPNRLPLTWVPRTPR